MRSSSRKTTSPPPFWSLENTKWNSRRMNCQTFLQHFSWNLEHLLNFLNLSDILNMPLSKMDEIFLTKNKSTLSGDNKKWNSRSSTPLPAVSRNSIFSMATGHNDGSFLTTLFQRGGLSCCA
ncbi:hypothetical protein CEXT_126301 [Caerostris extrusa]|uniref:Uncharacterized protein n=1 Tax=Caerostris extrusa TaxID=172846 RepID=A0AAV4XHM7_CAEEX|nr:hypothetical protein CEXT_126301 [Caerostris extrusa]